MQKTSVSFLRREEFDPLGEILFDVFVFPPQVGSLEKQAVRGFPERERPDHGEDFREDRLIVLEDHKEVCGEHAHAEDRKEEHLAEIGHEIPRDVVRLLGIVAVHHAADLFLLFGGNVAVKLDAKGDLRGDDVGLCIDVFIDLTAQVFLLLHAVGIVDLVALEVDVHDGIAFVVADLLQVFDQFFGMFFPDHKCLAVWDEISIARIFVCRK